jgi:hypothetical protein
VQETACLLDIATVQERDRHVLEANTIQYVQVSNWSGIDGLQTSPSALYVVLSLLSFDSELTTVDIVIMVERNHLKGLRNCNKGEE